jgi:hypothetical protein
LFVSRFILGSLNEDGNLVRDRDFVWDGNDSLVKNRNMFHKYESMMSMVKTEVDILMDNNFEREENTTSDACKSKETEEYQENLRHDDDF